MEPARPEVPEGLYEDEGDYTRSDLGDEEYAGSWSWSTHAF